MSGGEATREKVGARSLAALHVNGFELAERAARELGSPFLLRGTLSGSRGECCCCAGSSARAVAAPETWGDVAICSGHLESLVARMAGTPSRGSTLYAHETIARQRLVGTAFESMCGPVSETGSIVDHRFDAITRLGWRAR